MGKHTFSKGGEMTININAQEIRELHPRILVLGCMCDSRRKCNK